MNTPPTIKEKELRPLNNFIWQRLCEFLPSDKCRGKTQSHILIYGYAAIAMADKAELAQAMKSDDGFFDAMAQIGIDLTESEEREIGEYVQAVYNRWEAAQVVTESEGKSQTEGTHQVTEHT